MDKIIGYFTQNYVIAGFIFIVGGVIIGIFKQYWLIAGLNTKSSSELAKIDLDYVTKYFGLFFGIFGVFMVLSPILFDCFNVTAENRKTIFTIGVLSFVVFILLYFNVIKRKRVYNKNERDCSQS